MNIKHFILMMMAALFAVACSSDDDDNGDGDDYAALIAKTYTGSGELTVGDMVAEYLENKTLVVTRLDKNVVKAVLTINYGKGTNMAFETVEAEATVAKDSKSGNYTLTSKEKTYNNGGMDILSNMNGAITSTGEASVIVEFTPGKMPMPVRASFSTTKKNDYASLVSGNYTGDVEMSIEGSKLSEVFSKTLEISKTDEENVVKGVLTLDYGKGTMMAVESVEAKATVSYKNGQYELKGIETETSIMTTKMDGVITSDGEAVIIVTFTPKGMPKAIKASFNTKNAKDDAAAISGSYIGDAPFTVMMGDKPISAGEIKGKTLTITRIGANKISAYILMEYTYTTMYIESLMAEAEVSYNSETKVYTLTGIEKEYLDEKLGKNITSTIDGTIDADKKLVADLKFKPGAMPFWITAAYQGIPVKGDK